VPCSQCCPRPDEGRPRVGGSAVGVALPSHARLTPVAPSLPPSLQSSDPINIAVDANTDQVLSPTEKARGPDFDHGIENGFTHAGAALEAIKYMWSAFVTIGSIGIVFYGIGKKAYGALSVAVHCCAVC